MRTLEAATLEPAERRALERAVAALRAELGGGLVGVWLYGSRARGDPGLEDSDIDVLVIARDAVPEERLRELMTAAADAEGANPFAFSVFAHDLRWVAEERAIESLYLREIEHDGILLAGAEIRALEGFDEHELPPKYGPGGVLTRSLKWLEMGRRYLADAEASLQRGGFSSVIAGTAYYAMFYSARAALSEQGRVGRTHEGTWHLMRELFVEQGRFDPGLVARATQMQEHREGADYRGWTFDRAENEAHVRDAGRFVEAIERLIGAEPR
jgi:uncharacterized protein (UPF0332 family)/predicted nucleotidyltransferase